MFFPGAHGTRRPGARANQGPAAAANVCEPAHERIVGLRGLLRGVQILFRAYRFGAL